MSLLAKLNPQSRSNPLMLIIIVVLGIWMVLLFNFNQGQQISARYASLIDASMEMRLETTYGHLWLEELLSGDTDENITDITRHFDNALWYTNAMLKGGVNDKNEYLELKEPALREEIKLLAEQITELRALSTQRFHEKNSSLPGSSIDARYDAAFSNFITHTEEIELALQKIVLEEMQHLKSMHILIAVIVLLIAAGFIIRINIEDRLKQQQNVLIENAHNNLVLNAHTDPLTKTANRRAFDESLDHAFKYAMHHNTPISLMMIRIDQFNQYLNAFGQVKTDETLVKVGKIMQSICNSSDELVAHYGNIFAIILPNVQHSKQTAEAILHAVSSAQIPGHDRNDSSKQYLTVSIGLAEMRPDAGILLPEELIKKAESALEQASSEGENRIVQSL